MYLLIFMFSFNVIVEFILCVFKSVLSMYLYIHITMGVYEL